MNGPIRQGIDETVAHFLKNFDKPARLLVAVSGGGDSVGLLIALDDALKTGRFPGFSLLACTVDHALRSGSADEARWVAALCARRGIAHVTRRWDGPKPASAIQARAREVRHALLAEAARSHDADVIVTAHNLDDQRETIAMRRARRSDGAGLAGIAPATLVFGDIWVLRPLLAVARGDIRTHLQGIGQDWIEDPSNVNRSFERVRVRMDNAVAGADEATDATEPTGAAEARTREAGQGAAFLSRGVRVIDATLAVLPVAALPILLGGEAEWRAFLVLVAVLGGRAHLLDAHAAGRLKAFVEGGRLSRTTAGRVVFDCRREGLFLYREARSIAPITAAPFDQATWDDRWMVQNNSPAALTVRAAMTVADDAFGGPDVPPGVTKRAVRGRPLVMIADAPAPGHLFALRPILTPCDRYLPVFDLPLAQALAKLFGREPYPAPPARSGCDHWRHGECNPDAS